MERGKASSPEVASPAMISNQKSENDDDAMSSQYSSCGESEFDRYCSANSVMGTPSICSSTFTVFNDLMEAEFGGSARNSGPGLGFEDDGCGLETFSLGGQVERDCKETRRLSAESRVNFRSTGFELYGGDEATGFSSDDGGSGNEEVSEFDRGGANGSRVADEVEGCGLDGSSEEMGELGGEASSRGDHSEGEDSMYNYHSDGEDKEVGFSYFKNVDSLKKSETRDENPLLINSSEAFGLDDWDDFVKGSGGIGQPSLLFSVNDSKNQEERGVEVQIGPDSTLSKDSIEEDKFAINQVESDDESDGFVQSSVAKPGFSKIDESEGQDGLMEIPVASYRARGEFTKSSFNVPTIGEAQKLEKEDASHIVPTKARVQADEKLVDYSKNFCLDDEFDIGLEPFDEEFADKLSFDNGLQDLPRVNRNSNAEGFVNGGVALRDSKMKLESTYNSSTNQLISRSTTSTTNRNPPVLEGHSSFNPSRIKTEVHELNEFYNEVVLDMEEILLTSNESPGARFSQKNRALHLQSQLSMPLRDGGSSASTSGTDVAYPLAHQPLRIDGVEVIGARQKKGDVSFSEKLVGVKEHTVYKIRAYSGNDQWEIERRYRDFNTLYRRLKTLFAAQNWVLPAPWIEVEKESKKIFGSASPDVVSERSALIQESLRSILQQRFFTTPPSALTWFLSPQDSLPNSPASSSSVPRSNYFGNRENISTLGKTISLIVEIQPNKSVKQILEAQHYTCAGCYKHFDDEKTLIRDFAQTFGWGKPRLCEYTSQLFCSSCHTNETSVLPARVLQNWDFTQYPVSQMAKSYLDSIHDQPMLCVSAVNPFLFSKVPTLLHVMSVRRKIGSILSYIRCPFRGSINRGLGSRRYLLESNDFFALRDLIDLSKGAFSVLPMMVETVLKKMVEHITEQCLVCCDVGIPCSARQACNDPSSLIFPFQEDVSEECPSCKSVFHKACFGKLMDCHCGTRLRVGEVAGLTRRLSSGPFDFLGKGLTSGLSGGFLSGLFTKVRPETTEHRDDENVILMGSLPSNSL